MHVGGSQLAVGEAIGKVGSGTHLGGGYSPPQNGGTDIAEAGLFLAMNADMVAIEVIRRLLRDCGIEAEADAALELVLEILGSPALLEEEKFQACALAILTKLFAVAEKFGDAFNNRDYLVPADESIEAQSQVRICGEASADP